MDDHNENNELSIEDFIELRRIKKEKGLILREKVRTLADVDKLTDEEISLFILPLSRRRQLKATLKGDTSFIEARKKVIRKYVLKKQVSSRLNQSQSPNTNQTEVAIRDYMLSKLLHSSLERPQSPIKNLPDTAILDYIIKKHLDSPLERNIPDTTTVYPVKRPRFEEPIEYEEKPTSEVVIQANKSDEELIIRHKSEERSRSEMTSQVTNSEEGPETFYTDRPKDTFISTPEESAKKQPFIKPSDYEKVVIVLESFPEVQLEREMHSFILQDILLAYEKIPRGSGTSVAFTKWISTPEYLLISCRDKYSAQWLKDIVPKLKPWENCSLKTLSIDELAQPCVCTVAVPNEFGVKLTSDQILTRLSIANAGLDTEQWLVWGSSSLERNQIWTFAMDKASLNKLKELHMRPRCGFVRLKFRYLSKFWSGSHDFVTACSSSGDMDFSN